MALKRSKNVSIEDEFLARFCRAVMENAQTPELINQIATDAGFIRVCRQVAADEVDIGLSAFCKRNQLDEQCIRLRLQPVARALRLNVDAASEALDYYTLLGVAMDADEQAIKRAFRQKALRLHPDKRSGDDGQQFIALQAAYVHLSDPELRARYDRRPVENWIESPPKKPLFSNGGSCRSSWLIGLSAIALIAAAFGVDLYFRESSFFKKRSIDHYAAPEREVAEKRVAPIPSSTKDAAPSSDAEEQLKKRLNAFLEEYCAAYSKKDLERFSALFMPDATEAGKPFVSMLPWHGNYFHQVVQLDYRIHLDTFRQHEGAIDLQGEFASSYTMSDGRQGSRSGPIRMKLLETANRLRVQTLEYGSI